MSSHAVSTQSKANWGGGGVSPFGMSYGKMFMWFFLLSDAFTFSGLLAAYGFMRHKYTDIWPDPGHVFHHFPFYDGSIPLAYVGLMTFILIMSSVTMVLAVEAGHRNRKNQVAMWMLLTIIGGALFLGSQAWEWYNFIVGTPEGAVRNVLVDGVFVDQVVHGANMTYNEYGHTVFANFFFFITGFHGFHVFTGVLLNVIIYINVIRGTYEKRGHYEMVEKVGLYWHFVDLVWVFVFTFFYLL
ncbi:MAG: cytochrome c oxidase subunit 3 [Bacteroidia bacterium]|nr:cytochrome c oxidase subunit 3 [Bacteroidia bacterium]MCZ2248157.1 cytochrome c oxidase subunit 3 [Bacteroidia bacterium]